MSDTAALRIEKFRALHYENTPLLMPNPWDRGTTKLLEGMGFQALATTSLGCGISHGKRRPSFSALMDNVETICKSTNLPVNADLEDGRVDEPAALKECIRRTSALGAAGFSIEDATYDADLPIYDFGLSVERVAAAAEFNKQLPVPMVFTARADNHISGMGDIDDTIRRLKAYEQAGADVLYAPGLRTLSEIKSVTSEINRPLNVVMGYGDPTITSEQLAEVGVSRVSIGGALCRAAMKTFVDSSLSMLSGEFGFVGSIAQIDDLHINFD